MKLPKFDVIVIGCGGIGSATLNALSRRGICAAGIDQFSPPHAFGSSHGHTRAIRKAYFEHPNYVPLLEASYRLWHEMEIENKCDLMYLSGILEIGPCDGLLIEGIRRSAITHNLNVEFLSAEVTEKTFAGIRVPAGFEAAIEKDAGYLLVERCIETYLNAAKKRGATLYTNNIVLDWTSTGNSVQVETTMGCIEANSLVITAGPWASKLAKVENGARLELRQKHMYWYSNDNPTYCASSGFPVFAVELPNSVSNRIYYGFPDIGRGVKVAEHTRGVLVDSPDSIDSISDPDIGETTAFVTSYLTGIKGDIANSEACLYTMSHDDNFYLDKHPKFNNVAFAMGLSGHGFKFAPVLGEILADMCTESQLSYDIDFLRLNRGFPT